MFTRNAKNQIVIQVCSFKTSHHSLLGPLVWIYSQIIRFRVDSR